MMFHPKDLYFAMMLWCARVLKRHVIAPPSVMESVELWLDVSASCKQVAEGSTIIDLTEREPVVVQQGKGDASVFVPELAYA